MMIQIWMMIQKIDFQKYKKTIIKKIITGSLIYDEEDETFSYTLKKQLSDGTNGGFIKIKKIFWCKFHWNG